MRRSRAALTVLLAALAILLLGLYLVHKAGETVSGSPFGWALIALGIFGALSALAVAAGAYSE